MDSTRTRAEAALLAITIVWGTSFTLIKDALHDASTLVFLTLRFGIAALLLIPLFTRTLIRTRRPNLAGAIAAGVSLYFAYLLQTEGLRFTSASKSAFLTSLCVVMVPLLACFVYRNVPRPLEMAGVGMALIGMALLTGVGGREWLAAGFNKGDLMTVGCAAVFAIHVVLIGHLAKHNGFEFLSVIQVSTVAILGLLSFSSLETPVFRPSGRLWLALALTSVLCTALAYCVQSWAQRHTTPTRAAMIFAAEPVAAAATAWAVAGERLSGAPLFGAALILLGLVVVELKPSTAGKHP
ncbi:MAG: DMT family transporter [Bryobacterales bacterium]|nr:DMT family transporter [Bryobacterales bacterium]